MRGVGERETGREENNGRQTDRKWREKWSKEKEIGRNGGKEKRNKAR